MRNFSQGHFAGCILGGFVRHPASPIVALRHATAPNQAKHRGSEFTNLFSLLLPFPGRRLRRARAHNLIPGNIMCCITYIRTFFGSHFFAGRHSARMKGWRVAPKGSTGIFQLEPVRTVAKELGEKCHGAETGAKGEAEREAGRTQLFDDCSCAILCSLFETRRNCKILSCFSLVFFLLIFIQRYSGFNTRTSHRRLKRKIFIRDVRGKEKIENFTMQRSTQAFIYIFYEKLFKSLKNTLSHRISNKLEIDHFDHFGFVLRLQSLMVIFLLRLVFRIFMKNHF